MCWLSGVQQVSRNLRAGVHNQRMNAVWCVPASGIQDTGIRKSALVLWHKSQKGAIHGTALGDCHVTASQCMRLPSHNATMFSHSMRQFTCSTTLACSSSEKARPKPMQRQDGVSLPTAGLGIMGMFGLFGKRLILFLGGKKVAFGIISVVSLKKLLFLPAWLAVLSVSAGVQTTSRPGCCGYMCTVHFIV